MTTRTKTPDPLKRPGDYESYTGFNPVSEKYVTFSYDDDNNMTGISRYAGLTAQNSDLVAATKNPGTQY